MLKARNGRALTSPPSMQFLSTETTSSCIATSSTFLGRYFSTQGFSLGVPVCFGLAAVAAGAKKDTG